MSIGTDLLRYSDRKIILFDFETQRLNLMDDNLVWQAAWFVMQGGRIQERHNYYIKWPNFVMSPDAARVTRFQKAWVDNGHDPEFVLDAWESYAMDESCLLSGHNILGFDDPVWQLWRRALGRRTHWAARRRMLDTHLLARAHKQERKPDRANLLAWQHKISDARIAGQKTKLSLMAKELGAPVDESRLHDANYDLELNGAVLWKLINVMEI